MNKPISKAQLGLNQKAEAQAARARKYRAVFDSAEGQEVLNDILERICGCGQPIMSTNQMAVFIQGTRRDVGDTIRRMIEGRAEQTKGDE